MLKKPLKYLCFSLLLLIAACAPKPKLAVPPPLYIGEELSIEDLVLKAGHDIDVIKAIAEIKIEKDNALYDSVNASVLIKRPGLVHMRIYKFGILVRDFIVMDKELYVLSGKNSSNLKRLGSEFYNAVFWWDGLGEGVMSSKGREYIIRTGNRKIHINRATLLPVKQELTAFNRKIAITYAGPKKTEDGFWYPSVINIYLNNFKFTVTIRKMLKNPSLGEFDFKVPAES